MPVQFNKFNAEWEAANPGDPSYTETGEDTATSIERLNNNEDANEDTLRRPGEQLRRRTRHIQEEMNLQAARMASNEGRFIDMRGATLTWNGLAHATVAKRGVFELSSSIYIPHPAYPDTLYEVPQTIIGNETTGFFNSEYNRLKEEGDSLWAVFGALTDDSLERDAIARAAGQQTLVQAQLRKGPTWVMIKETVTDLSAIGIVKGSDLLRIYPDPIGNPAVVLKRTIRDFFQDTDGNWFVEVAHDAPLWDETLPAKPIPSNLATTKRSRVSNGAEYDIVDVTEVTTRQAQQAFASYHSNLEWFGAARVDPLSPYNTTTDNYRANEWANAVPLAMVSNGNLVFPLAGVAGVAPETSGQSLSGFVRTSLPDTITASHTFAAYTAFERASGLQLVDFRTDSPALGVGAGSHIKAIDEAHTDGNVSSPTSWIQPARPARSQYYGFADAYTNPFYELVEQGMYTSGGGYWGKENAIRLRRMGELFYIPTLQGTTYNELTASQLPYILSILNANTYQRQVAYSMDDATIPSITGHGVAVGTYFVLGTSGLYETMRGKHDVIVEGSIGLRDVYPLQIDTISGDVAGAPHGKHSQGIRFYSYLRLTPDGVTASNPMVIAVQMADAKPLIYSTLRDALVAAGSPSPAAASLTQDTVVEPHTAANLSADGGNQNRSYPAAPTGGSTLVFESLFMSDLSEYTTGPVQTTTKLHSQINVRLVAVPTHDGGSSEHRLAFYLQFDFHNEEADVTEVDFLRKNMYTKNFRNMFAAANASSGTDPYLTCDLKIFHVPRWDAPF